MSGIGEGLAEAGQGTLAAAAVDGGASAGASADRGHTHESACLNCGAALMGSHCHACGQAAHVHRTLGAFFHDLLHGVFHFEGKVWRTLPLLAWQPGRLTREYIDGRRASYVSPLALFLFSVFLMFAVFHALEGVGEGAEDNARTTVNVRGFDSGIAELEGQIARLRTERKAAAAARRPTDGIDDELETKEDALDALRELKARGLETAGGKIVASDDPVTVTSSFPRVAKAVEKFKENPELGAYKLQTSAYKYSWALIPISVPFVWLLFPFSRRFHLYDHAVFVTYSLCFMTLLVIVAMVANAAGLDGLVVALATLVPPLHMYRQLRGAYALRRRSALWRTVLLLLFSLSAMMIFFVMIMAQSSL